MIRASASDIRSKILEAAQERLWNYGFKKTTIDEIAQSAGVGKGTVYLHFDSKEDIALAIIAQYKRATVEAVQAIAHDSDKDLIQRLKEMLSYPILRAHELCGQSPGAQEIVVAIRPHIQARMKPFNEQEVALIAEILEEGNHRKVFAIEDSMQTARTLKYMLGGFWPPFPVVTEISLIETEIARIIDLTVRGLRSCPH